MYSRRRRRRAMQKGKHTPQLQEKSFVRKTKKWNSQKYKIDRKTEK
jgi:hypothetical protein